MDSARPSRLSHAEREELVVRARSARALSHQRVVACLRLRTEAEQQTGAAKMARECVEVELSLRESVKIFADLLRRIEAAPEDAVIQVKQIVRDASAGAPNAEWIVERDLTAEVVAWAIEGYFAAA